MSESPSQVLLIFIKNPIEGNVKTRLAETVGKKKALLVYQKLLDYTRTVALEAEADRQLWYSRYTAQNDGWNQAHFTKEVQDGESLGDRMKYAFEQAFNNGYEKAVIIGSDCAQLQPNHIEEAYAALDDSEVVIGPSEDGGYYLLGMNQYLPVLFEDKSWSTESVFEQTVTDCKENDLKYAVLEELNDVDTEEDWEQVQDKF